MSVVQFYWIFTMFQVLCQVLYMQHCLGVCVRWFLGQLGCFRSAGIGAVYLGYSSVFTQCWWHFSLRIGFTEFENLNSCWATALFHQGVLLSARVYMLCDVLIRKTFASGWDPPGSWSDFCVQGPSGSRLLLLAVVCSSLEKPVLSSLLLTAVVVWLLDLYV